MEDRIQDVDGCCQSHALDDLALIAAIDGEASPEVMAHLRSCSYCAARAQGFAHLQGQLRKQFFRMFCPSTDDLVAFHHGMRSEIQRAELDTHLRDCPHCQRELRLLKQIASEALSGRAPPPLLGAPGSASGGGWPAAQAVAEPVRCVLATPTAIAPPLLELYGAPRAGYTDQYAYQAENLQITLDVHRVVNQAERRVLVGVLSLDEDLPAAGCYASAYDVPNNRLISTAELDELGSFVLENLSPGAYRLLLHLPDREVVIEALSL